MIDPKHDAMEHRPVIAIAAAWPVREDLLLLLQAIANRFAAACIVFDSPAPGARSSRGPAPALTPEALPLLGAAWAQDGAELQPGAVLLAPASATVALAGGRLAVEPGEGADGLDAFAVRLAEAAGRSAVLVVLAGEGCAGVLGAAAIRARGGLAVTAAEAGTALAGDTALPAADIPDVIAAHLDQPPLGTLGAAPPFRPAAGFAWLASGRVRSRREGGRLRAWLLGCGTGEAAYSLAVALREQLGVSAAPPQIFASDIDDRSLAAARAGRYPVRTAGEIAPERLQRWFVREGLTYTVRPELRELCVFSAHHPLRDPPFSRVDLICCCLPLHHLGDAFQDQLMQRFHFALNPGGLLRFSASGMAARHGRLFAPAADDPLLYLRRDNPPVRPVQPVPDLHSAPALARWRRAGAAAITAEAKRIAASNGPPFVVVDDALHVLHFSGRMGRYLAPSAGEATLNVLQLVHDELRPSLAALLQRVALTGQPAQSPRLTVGSEPASLALTLLAEPMAHRAPDAPRTIVMFCDANGLPADAALNSAQRELEHSREELRSLGEEFQAVSSELAARVADLTRVNSDMRNVFESTQIAIVFLNAELLVQGFTPASAAVIHLVATDVGRPVGDVALRVDYPGLVHDAQHVLRTLATIEREVAGLGTDHHYLVRILPYRRVDNFIAGVVVTFLDVTAAYQAERARRDSEERFRVMADIVPAFLFIADSAGAWQYVNPPFYAFTGLPDGSALGEGWWAAIHAEDAASGRQAWHQALVDRSALELECRLNQAGGGTSWFLLRAVPQAGADGAVTAWFGSCTNIDATRRAGQRQRELLSELQHRVKNILSVVRSVTVRSVESSTTMDDMSAHLSGRISAIARIQSVIARNPGDAVVLSELVDDELAAQGGQAERQADVEGPVVLLADTVAESLGLAFHELTTNAIKYGALSIPAGRLHVRWQLYPLGVADPPQQRLVLEWQESGVPITDLRPARSGFGRHLLESGLSDELDASTSLEFRPGGIRWLIQLTVPGEQWDLAVGHAGSVL